MTYSNKRYVIAATARSGSSLLADYLRQTSVLGNPSEVLNKGTMKFKNTVRNIRNKRLGLPVPKDQLERMRCIINSENPETMDVFGVKILASQFFGRSGAERDEIDSRLMSTHRFIFLKRKDKAKQAISHSIAAQTGSWSTKQSPSSTAEPSYSFYDIIQSMYEAIGHEKMWEAYFAKNRIKPLRVSYEELIEDKQRVIKSIFLYLNKEPSSSIDESVKVRGRQYSDVNEEFLRLFRQDYKDAFGIDYYESEDYGHD